MRFGEMALRSKPLLTKATENAHADSRDGSGNGDDLLGLVFHRIQASYLRSEAPRMHRKPFYSHVRHRIRGLSVRICKFRYGDEGPS